MGDEELVYHKQNGSLEIGVECLLHFVKSDQEGLVVMVLVVDYTPKVPVANGRRLPFATCQAVWHVYRDGVVVGSYASYRERFPVSNAYLPLFRRTAVDAYVVGADIDSIYHIASPCVVIEIFVCQIFKSVVLVFALDLLSPVLGWLSLLPLVPLPHIIFLVVGSFDELHHSSGLPSGREVSFVGSFLRFHCQTAQAEAHEQKHLREPIVS